MPRTIAPVRRASSRVKTKLVPKGSPQFWQAFAARGFKEWHLLHSLNFFGDCGNSYPQVSQNLTPTDISLAQDGQRFVLGGPPSTRTDAGISSSTRRANSSKIWNEGITTYARVSSSRPAVRTTRPN